MKWFRRINEASGDDPWSPNMPALLFQGDPQSKEDFEECLEEISALSGCCNSGRCCERAPELTHDERQKLEAEYPGMKLEKGKPCPFRQNGGCAVHDKTEGFTKPLQCRSYICRPLVRNNQEWLRRFCNHWDLEF